MILYYPEKGMEKNFAVKKVHLSADTEWWKPSMNPDAATWHEGARMARAFFISQSFHRSAAYAEIAGM